MNPLISFIIPAYNEEKYIERTLKSLIGQKTKVPYEIVVCDNNSTDKTVEVAKKYADKVVFEKRQGSAYARNTGVKSSKGRYLVHTDADTIFPENFIEEVYKIFKKNVYVGFTCGHWDYCEDTSFRNNVLTKVFSFLHSSYLNISGLMNKLDIPCWCLCTPREVFNKVGGFKNILNLAEDTQYNLDINSLGKKAYFPKIMVRTSTRRFFESGLINTIKHYNKKKDNLIQNIKNITPIKWV